MPNSVRFYDSTMSGAPALSGTAGALIGVLDGCLVDGFGSVTVNSLVVASNVATATVSAGHQFAMIGTTGPVIRIAGASPAGLNGDWRISVTSATTFTFPTSGIADQTASGTITAKRAPAGFSKAFSGTNKAAYRADDVQSTRLYLRVDDTGTTTYAGVMYEAMTDVDTGTGAGATLTGNKSSASSSEARGWMIVADQQVFYLLNTNGGATNAYDVCMVFGDVVSYKSGDAFHARLLISTTNTSSSIIRLSTHSNSYFARSYTQLGASVAAYQFSHNITTGTPYMGGGGSPYPNPVDNSAHFWPVEIWEGSTVARGLVPGLWNPIHVSGITTGVTIDDIPQLPGRTLLICAMGSYYRCAFDLTGPWR